VWSSVFNVRFSCVCLQIMTSESWTPRYPSIHPYRLCLSLSCSLSASMPVSPSVRPFICPPFTPFVCYYICVYKFYRHWYATDGPELVFRLTYNYLIFFVSLLCPCVNRLPLFVMICSTVFYEYIYSFLVYFSILLLNHVRWTKGVKNLISSTSVLLFVTTCPCLRFVLPSV
jgi:hypothetical protein